MDKLYGWSAARAGSSITIKHSTGKVTGIGNITVEEGKLIATRAAGCGSDGRQFELDAPARAGKLAGYLTYDENGGDEEFMHNSLGDADFKAGCSQKPVYFADTGAAE